MVKQAILLLLVQIVATNCRIIPSIGESTNTRELQKDVGRRTGMTDIPDQLDWRTQGVVTSVKNQGALGSSLILTIVDMIESDLAVRTGKLNILSIQQILDCCPTCKIDGLDSVGPIVEYIHKFGLERESDYPYHQGVNSSCKYNSKLVVQGTTGVLLEMVISGNETDLKIICATRGPVLVVIDVTRSFQVYSSGIFYDEDCDPNNLNHAMLLVGYGTEEKEDYWIVKNSWGTEWGNEGYVMMSRNRNDNCGIAELAFSAIITLIPIEMKSAKYYTN
ncbi:Cathepsin L [Oopsacas minuta]|uniref:Cathepsin L n=1 Tax=Oopsacas minuta TaxID=111878 RepID=A0AAV7KF91_9METZ|nr:Cathepsin L [Oopsacas minuta]